MSKKANTFILVSAIVLAAGLFAGAQGRQQGYGSRQCISCQTNFDPASAVSLEGIVESVNMGPGQGLPTFTLNRSDNTKAIIIASPFRVLLSANYKIALGDHMQVLAFPSLNYENTYVAAELKNLTNGTILTLRDATGTPVAGSEGVCCGCAGNPNGIPGQGRRW